MPDDLAVQKVSETRLDKPSEENVKIVYVHKEPPVQEDFWTTMGKAFYEADPEMWNRWIETQDRKKRSAARARSKKRSKR